MRIVIALGGNALLRRGEPLTAENQRQNVRIACEQIAKIYPNNELVIAHVGRRIRRHDWLYDSTRIR